MSSEALKGVLTTCTEGLWQKGGKPILGRPTCNAPALGEFAVDPTVWFGTALADHEASDGKFFCGPFLRRSMWTFWHSFEDGIGVYLLLDYYPLNIWLPPSKHFAFLSFDTRTVMRFLTLPQPTYNIIAGTKMRLVNTLYNCEILWYIWFCCDKEIHFFAFNLFLILLCFSQNIL